VANVSSVLVAQLNPASIGLDVSADTSAVLHRKPYPHSLVYSCSVFCHERTGIVEYAIPAGYTTFTAVVGVADDAQEADQIGTFEVYLNGSRAASVSTRLGTPETVRVRLGNASRLKLVASRPGTVGRRDRRIYVVGRQRRRRGLQRAAGPGMGRPTTHALS
jgi:hypothetical protein